MLSLSRSLCSTCVAAPCMIGHLSAVSVLCRPWAVNSGRRLHRMHLVWEHRGLLWTPLMRLCSQKTKSAINGTWAGVRTPDSPPEAQNDGSSNEVPQVSHSKLQVVPPSHQIPVPSAAQATVCSEMSFPPFLQHQGDAARKWKELCPLPRAHRAHLPGLFVQCMESINIWPQLPFGDHSPNCMQTVG